MSEENETNEYEVGFERYQVGIALKMKMLGTNPLDPNIMDKHIIDRQRKLIAEKSNVNKAINKYLDARDISDDKKALDLYALRKTIERCQVLRKTTTTGPSRTHTGGVYRPETYIRWSQKTPGSK